MIEITPIKPTNHPKYNVASGKIGNAILTRPYPPIFSRSAARITDIGVEASTCASGNHVCNGTMGSLMANPTKRRRKAHDLALYGPNSQGLLGSRLELEITLAGSIMCSMLNVWTSLPEQARS